jgi:hypothetical protein
MRLVPVKPPGGYPEIQNAQRSTSFCAASKAATRMLGLLVMLHVDNAAPGPKLSCPKEKAGVRFARRCAGEHGQQRPPPASPPGAQPDSASFAVYFEFSDSLLITFPRTPPSISFE